MTKEVPWEYDIDISVMRGKTKVKDLSALNQNLKYNLKRIKGTMWTITEINHQPEAGEEENGWTHATVWADVDVKESEVWAIVKKATKALKYGGWEIEKIVIYPQHPS